MQAEDKVSWESMQEAVTEQYHHHDDDEDGDECCCGHHHHDHDEDEEEEHEHHHHHHHDDDDDECSCGHHHHDHDGDEDEEEHGHHHHHDEDEDDDECSCGHHHHDHDEDEEEEHGHHHHHHDDDDDDECCCGHHHHDDDGDEEEEHGHHHHHHDDDDEDEEYDHGHDEPREHKAPRTVYIVENLDCAHCAARMEAKIREMPGIEDAQLTYTTKQLRVWCENAWELVPEMERLCQSVDADVKLVYKSGGQHVSGSTAVFVIDGLDCAHCAAKIEDKVLEIDGIEDAVLTFATKQLKITADRPGTYLPQIEEVCRSVEPDASVRLKDDRRTAEAAQKEKDEEADEARKDLTQIIAGAVLFAAGLIAGGLGIGIAALIIYIAAYLILGLPVLRKALANIKNGNMLDENFLMSIASLGAFLIGEYPEAVGVMLFDRIGEYFEDRAVARSRSQIMEAVDLRPEVVNLVRGSGTVVISAEEARTGDILLVRPGDRIPLDGHVTEGESRIDTSPVTGEPVPVHVGPGDAVTSGCVNTSGQLYMCVEKELQESMVTRILESVENAAATKPKVDRFITRFANIYTPVVIAIAAFTAIVPSVFTGNWRYYIYTALTFLVISCPCAIVLSVPLSFFSGIGAGSKKGILFKGGLSIEALADVKAVVMDKTGTLTKGNFAVQSIEPSGMSAEELLTICAGCEKHSTHPIAASIMGRAAQDGITVPDPDCVQEIAGHGIKAVIGGKTVLCGNRTFLDESQVAYTAGDAGAGTEVLVSVDGIYAGRILIADSIKPEAAKAMSDLKSLGLTTAMLTGDGAVTANAVSAELGIDEVRAKLLPEDKLSAMQELREKYTSVMYVGDGINDAPVLAGADVGAAMGSGSDAAIEAADVVYMTSSAQAIPDSIRIARMTRRISNQNIVFALAVKILVMILGLAGFASMWAAVFADTGVSIICIINSIRILYKKI